MAKAREELKVFIGVTLPVSLVEEMNKYRRDKGTPISWQVTAAMIQWLENQKKERPF